MGKLVWLFGVLNTIGICMVPIYNLLQYKEKKKILGGVAGAVLARSASEQRRGPWASVAFWVILETILVSVVQHYLAGYANGPFGELFNTGANYFGLLLLAPFLVGLVCWLMKIDYLAQYDLITPAYPLALIFTKFACYAAGCCRGFSWEGGIYNPITNLTEFPAQLLEAAMALALFFFMRACRGKLKKGTMFPVYVMVYSGTRFFTEYTRCEPKVFFGCLKTYQVLCVAGVLVGFLEYFLVCRYNAHVRKKAEAAQNL